MLYFNFKFCALKPLGVSVNLNSSAVCGKFSAFNGNTCGNRDISCAHFAVWRLQGRVVAYKEEKKAASEKDIKKVESQDNIEKPLFPGYYLRDTTVTEFEKAAEASNAIINAIKGKLNGRKKSNKRADGKQPSAFKI